MLLPLAQLTDYRNISLRTAQTLPNPSIPAKAPITLALAQNQQAQLHHLLTVPLTVQWLSQLGDPEAATWFLNTKPFNNV